MAPLDEDNTDAASSEEDEARDSPITQLLTPPPGGVELMECAGARAGAAAGAGARYCGAHADGAGVAGAAIGATPRAAAAMSYVWRLRV